MNLEDRSSIGEGSQETAEVGDIPTPFPASEPKPSDRPKPGKYIICSGTGRILGIQIAESYQDTVVFTNYKRSSIPGLVRRDGTMFDGETYIQLEKLNPDYRLIFKLGTKKNVEHAKKYNKDGFLNSYTTLDSFYK